MNKYQQLSMAIHILCALALKSPGGYCSRELAASLQANPAFVRRVLGRLAGTKLVSSGKGPRGGCRLAMRADRITMRRIYEAVGPVRIFKSFEKKPYKKCPVSCAMKPALDRLYEDFESALLERMGRVTLESFLKKLKI